MAAIKICSLPAEVPFENSWDNWQEHEAKHTKELTEWARNHGYDGKNTGRIYREPAADGYAQYMMMEPTRGKGKPTVMVHLPYGDGYEGRAIQYMGKRDILAEIDRLDKFAEMFK